MLQRYVHDTLTRNRRRKTSTGKPELVSGNTEFFLVSVSTNGQEMLYFRVGLWYQFSGTGFRRRFLVRVSCTLGLHCFRLQT